MEKKPGGGSTSKRFQMTLSVLGSGILRTEDGGDRVRLVTCSFCYLGRRLVPRTDASGTITVEIEGDALEADVGEMVAGHPNEVGVESLLQLLGGNLDAREAVMIAHPELLEPPRPEKGFGLLDSREPLFGDAQTGGDPRGETCHRGFVRDREAIVARDLPYFLLRDVVFQEGRVGVQLIDRPEARRWPSPGSAALVPSQTVSIPSSRAALNIAKRRIVRQ